MRSRSSKDLLKTSQSQAQKTCAPTDVASSYRRTSQSFMKRKVSNVNSLHHPFRKNGIVK